MEKEKKKQNEACVVLHKIERIIANSWFSMLRYINILINIDLNNIPGKQHIRSQGLEVNVKGIREWAESENIRQRVVRDWNQRVREVG